MTQESPPQYITLSTKFEHFDPKSLDLSISNVSAGTVLSVDLFKPGRDDVLLEGYLYKFKPGLSTNFVQRYVQLSSCAFRYFKNEQASKTSVPLVSFRKRVLKHCTAIRINKESYIKRGSRLVDREFES